MQAERFDEIVRELCTTILSEPDPERLPDRILEHVQRTFHVEWATLWVTEQQVLSVEKLLRLKAATGAAKRLLHVERDGAAAWYAFGEGLTGYIAQQRRAINITRWADFLQFSHKKKYDRDMYGSAGAEGKCKAVLGIPLLLQSAGGTDGYKPDWRVIGVLKLENVDPAYRPGGHFTREDVRIIEAYAAVVAVALEKAQMKADSLRIGSGLLTVSANLLAQLGEPPGLNRVVKETAQVISAQACALWLRSGLELRLAASWGYPDAGTTVPAPYHLSENSIEEKDKPGLTVHVAREKEALNLRTLEEVRNHPAWRGANDATMWKVPRGEACYSLLAVPLIDDETEQVRGVFKIENKRPTIYQLESYFSTEDQKLLTALGNSINSSLAIAERFIRLQQLERIAGQIRYPEGEEAALFLLLTALTHGGGLGYNRALAFMSDGEERPTELTCRFAVGHLDMERWNQAMQSRPPKPTLDLGRKMRNFTDTKIRYLNTEILKQWKGVRVSIVDLASQKLAHQAANEHSSMKYLSKDLAADDVLRGFTHGDFALIPIHEEQRLRGIIYCDNRFTGNTINRFELQLLDVFAGIAGAVLDAAEVPARVRRTEEQAWRQFSQPAAHRLGTETNIIDGEVSYYCTPQLGSLSALVGEDNASIQEIRKSLEVIRGSARRLRDAAKDYRQLSADQEPPEVLDLAAHIQHSITGAKLSTLAIDFAPPAKAVYVRVRPRRLSYVFDELFLNAWKESPAANMKPGEPVRVQVRMREADNQVEVLVADSGPGIAPNVEMRLFHGPQSGRHGGTGLGLMLIKRHLEAEGGSICLFPAGRSDAYSGACFRILIPRLTNVESGGQP